MLDGRKRLAGALTTLCIAAMGGSVFVASPSSAEPSIADVRARVDRLYHEAEQASERYNDIRVQLDESKERLARLQKDIERQRAAVEAVRGDVAAAVVAQYQGQALSTAAQVMLSEDPQKFLSHLTTVSEHNSQQANRVEAFAVELDRLELQEKLAEQELDVVERAEATMAEEKQTIDEKAAEAEELLDEMEAEEREVRASRSTPRVPTATAPVSGRAAAAVQYALAQVGDAYVWGASGPNAYDCSGLTSAAWAQAGVSLPHSSSAQMSSGARVSSSDLRPGDLVFYYSPVSHVGIYIGDGKIVDAANPSTGVRVTSVFSMPFSGAVRPG